MLDKERCIRIAIFGAGGVGGYFGGRLAQAGEDVTFVARGAHLQAMRTRGLRVDSINGDFVLHPVQATDDPAAVGQVDSERKAHREGSESTQKETDR